MNSRARAGSLPRTPRRRSDEPARCRLTRGVAGRPQGAAGQGEGADPARATRSTPSGASCRWSRSRRTTCSTGPDGEATLLDLFEGRRQLIVYHFMFDPSWEDGCPSCTAGADEMSRRPARAPARPRHDARLRRPARRWPSSSARRRKRGWTFPWYSSYGSDFNYDFHVTIDESVAPVEYNYRTPERVRSAAGTAYYVEGEQPIEMPGQQLLPARRRPRLPHVLARTPAALEIDRRLVLLPRPHRPRPPGGLGGAEGPRRRPARRHARLRDLSRVRSRSRPSPAPATYASATTSSAATTRRASLRRRRARARRRLGDRLGAEQLLDDGLLEAEPALAAYCEQLLRAAQVEDLGAVGGRQAVDQERVAPREAHERVGPRTLRRGSPPRGPRRRRRPPRCPAGRSGF